MISSNEILYRLFAAALFGAAIGFERERKQWSTAGLRTHMMVCVGACLIMMVSAFGFSDVLDRDKVVLDPSRVAAQVVSGIGFIGAGAIVLLKQTQMIKGLTTAAGLWTVAAIGLAAGGGMYYAAGMTTLIALAILWALKPLERRLTPKATQKYLRFTVASSEGIGGLMGNLVLNRQIAEAQSKVNDAKKETSVHIVFNNPEESDFAEMIAELQINKEIKEISWGDIFLSESSRK